MKYSEISAHGGYVVRDLVTKLERELAKDWYSTQYADVPLKEHHEFKEHHDHPEIR